MHNVVSRSHAMRLITALIILLSVLPIAAFATPVFAVGPTVVTTTALTNNPNDNACSLREALQAAFSQQVNGTASQSYNECTVYAGPTTITFGGNAAAGAIYNNLNSAPALIVDSAFTANISGDLAQGGAALRWQAH